MICLSEAIRRLQEVADTVGDMPLVFADGVPLADIIHVPLEAIDLGDGLVQHKGGHVVLTDIRDEAAHRKEVERVEALVE